MYTEGPSGVFVAVALAVVGAIVLSAAGLLVLRDQTPLELVTPSATESAASPSPTTPASAANGTAATPSPSPTATTTPTASPTPTATPTPTPEPELEYVVAAGDGVEIIATRFGVPAAAIIERNNLQPPYTLAIGQVLIIPTEE